jgi:mannose-1-phosphate guanylyltransferase
MTHSPRAEAVIIAGGYGTRLFPLTETRPKHLLEVGGVPLLEHLIAKLARAGINHVVLATSYLAELIEPLIGCGDRFGIQISYAFEKQPLGTGGAIRNAATMLSGDSKQPIVVLNGDVLSAHDLVAQLADFDIAQEGRKADVSIHIRRVMDPSPFGCIEIDGIRRISKFKEKADPPISNLVNAGCYIIRRGVIDSIPTQRIVSIERETFPELIERGASVLGYFEMAYWRDIGSPADLVSASADVVLGAFLSGAAAPADGGILVAQSADVRGIVMNGTVVMDGAKVSANSEVYQSIVMRDARLGSGSVIRNSIIGQRAVVGEGARLEQVALGDGVYVSPGARPSPGTRISANNRL